MDVGKKFNCVYFNYKNGCRLVNPFLGLNITELPEESFFGDYQILLGICSVFDYVAHSDENDPDEEVQDINQAGNTWCLTIPDSKFLKLCDQFPKFRSYVLERGLARRAFLQYVQKDLISILDIK